MVYPLRPPLFNLNLPTNGPQGCFDLFNELRAMEAEVCGYGIIMFLLVCQGKGSEKDVFLDKHGLHSRLSFLNFVGER